MGRDEDQADSRLDLCLEVERPHIRAVVAHVFPREERHPRLFDDDDLALLDQPLASGLVDLEGRFRRRGGGLGRGGVGRGGRGPDHRSGPTRPTTRGVLDRVRQRPPSFGRGSFVSAARGGSRSHHQRRENEKKGTITHRTPDFPPNCLALVV